MVKKCIWWGLYLNRRPSGYEPCAIKYRRKQKKITTNISKR
jgi:hypothetical protein